MTNGNWVPDWRELFWQYNLYKTLADPKRMEMATWPFAWTGQETSRLFNPREWGHIPVRQTEGGTWGIPTPFLTRPEEPKDIAGQFQAILPGGERYEQYEEKPLYEQMIWELPAFLLPGMGITKTALKAPTLTGAITRKQATKLLAQQVAKGEKPAPELIEKIAPQIAKKIKVGETQPTPFGQKMQGALDYALKVQRETTEVYKLQRAIKAGKLKEIFAKEKGVQSYKEALRALRGRLEKAKFKMPAEFQITAEEAGAIINSIARKKLNSYETLDASTAVMKLAGLLRDKAGLPLQLQKHEIQLLSDLFPELRPVIAMYQTMGSKAWATFVDVANIPRAFRASGDFSVTLRQLALGLSRKPQHLPKVVMAQARTVFNPRNWKAYDEAALANPDVQLFMEHGMYRAPEPGKAVSRLWAREEMFQSNLAERIPGIGKFIRASERAFTAGANTFRDACAKDYANMLRKGNLLHTAPEELAGKSSQELLDIARKMGIKRRMLSVKPLTPSGLLGEVTTPTQAQTLKRVSSSLANIVDDRAFRRALGEGTEFWDETIYNQLKAGKSITVYRAAPLEETKIYLGSRVTHSERSVKAIYDEMYLPQEGHILKTTATADDLIYQMPGEFILVKRTAPVKPVIPKTPPSMPRDWLGLTQQQLVDRIVAQSDANIEGLAQIINWASGRGSFPHQIRNTAPLVNALFFAPRFVLSRIYDTPRLLISPNPIVRKEAWRTVFQALGVGATIMGMAKLSGADVKWNPLNSNVGKIKVGNTYLDIWAGYIQYYRFLAQFTMGKREITGTKREQEIDRLQTVWRLLQSKGSPIFSLVVDLMAGETYVGEPMFEGGWKTARREAMGRLSPFVAQDILEALEESGLIGGMVAGPAAFMGLGVVSYKPRGKGGLPELEPLKPLPQLKPLPSLP